MVKTWLGWTEKRWREMLKWHITTHLLTEGSKAEWCYRHKRMLQLEGEWDMFPKELKWNIQIWAWQYEKMFSSTDSKMTIKYLEEQKIEIDKQILYLRKGRCRMVTPVSIVDIRGKEIIDTNKGDS
jgi:serine/threonine protein phosphatase PrpC